MSGPLSPQSSVLSTPAYALVLAAGRGSRFGGAKLLAPLDGRPLAAHVATTVAAAIQAGYLGGGIAVGRVDDSSLAWYFETCGLKWVVNPAADEGVSTSLRLGLAELSAAPVQPAPGAAMILLADQPLVRIEVIAGLVEHWRRTGRSVRPRYAAHPAEPGHPVLLDRRLWPLADSLEGDVGFGSALRLGPDAVDLVDVAGGNPDIDTPNDLSLLPDVS